MNIKKLSDIAQITSGTAYRQEDLTSRELGKPFYTISELKSDYTLSEPSRFINTNSLKSHIILSKNDILISKVGANIKLALVKETPAEDQYFSNNLIRLRILENTKINPEKLLIYLSESCKDLITNLQRGTAQPYIRNEDLGNIEIILDTDDSIEQDPLQSLIIKLERKILDLKENPSKEKYGKIIKEFYENLTSEDIQHNILTNFPYPISYRFSQYLDSQHDKYQKLTRLRDVYESITYFLYNTFLSDYLMNLDKTKINIDKNIKKTYNNYSVTYRLFFIQKIIEQCKGTTFIPNLDLSTIEKLLLAQDEFRNKISHMATFSENLVIESIEKYSTFLYQIFEEIDFLKDYSLIRVKSWSYSKGEKLALIETYRGIKTKIDQEQLPREIAEDKNHLLLIKTTSDDFDYLNLHPFYQIFSNSETKHQEFMVYLKQRKFATKELNGECIPWSFDLNISGFDYLEEKIKGE